MRSPISKASCLLAASFFVALADATCSADNCYRALFPCPSPSALSVAWEFCQTVTASGTTATNYPTRATAQCGATPARYISACQCGPTCDISTVTSTTPPPTSTTSSSSSCTPTGGGLVYGDFECGTPAPWTVQVNDPAMAAMVATPGFTGNLTFLTEYIASSTCEDCDGVRILSPSLPITPNTHYKLTWATWMPATSSGFVGCLINERGGLTIDVFDFPQSVWHFSQTPWTSLSTETAAQVVFDFYGPAARLDSITFAPASAYCGSDPPIGILPDGEFECGLGAWSQEVDDPECVAGVAATPASYGNGPFGLYAWGVTSTNAAYFGGISASIATPPLPVTGGATYLLDLASYATAAGIGKFLVYVNADLVLTAQASPSSVNYFFTQQIFWAAPAGAENAVVKIEASFINGGTMWIDAVVFAEVTP